MSRVITLVPLARPRTHSPIPSVTDDAAVKSLLSMFKQHAADMRNPLDVKKVTRAMLEMTNNKLFVDNQPLIDIDAFYANSEKGMSAIASSMQIGLEAELSDDMLVTDPKIQRAVNLHVDYYISMVRQYQILQRRPKHEWASFQNTIGHRRLMPGKPMGDVQFVKMLFNMLFMSLERTMISRDESEDLTLMYEGVKYGECYTIEKEYDDDESPSSATTATIGVRLNADGSPKRPRKRRGKLVESPASSNDIDHFNQRFHANRGAWITLLESRASTLVPAPNMVKFWPEIKVLITKMLKRMRSDDEYSEEDESHLFSMREMATGSSSKPTTTAGDTTEENPDVLFFKVLFGGKNGDVKRRNSLSGENAKPNKKAPAAVPWFEWMTFKNLMGVMITMAVGVAIVTTASVWADSYIIEELTRHNTELTKHLGEMTTLLSKLDTQTAAFTTDLGVADKNLAAKFDEVMLILANAINSVDKTTKFTTVVTNMCLDAKDFDNTKFMNSVNDNKGVINEFYTTLRTYGATNHILNYAQDNPTEILTKTRLTNLLAGWYNETKGNPLYFPNLPIYGKIIEKLNDSEITKTALDATIATEIKLYKETLSKAKINNQVFATMTDQAKNQYALKLTQEGIEALKDDVAKSISGFRESFEDIKGSIKGLKLEANTLIRTTEEQRKHLIEVVAVKVDKMKYIANSALTAFFAAIGGSEGSAVDASTIRMLVEMIPAKLMQTGNLMMDLPKTLLQNSMRKQTTASKTLLVTSIVSIALEYFGVVESIPVLSSLRNVFNIGAFALPLLSAMASNLIPDVTPSIKVEKRRKEITTDKVMLAAYVKPEIPTPETEQSTPIMARIMHDCVEERLNAIDILVSIFNLIQPNTRTVTNLTTLQEYIDPKTKVLMFTEAELLRANDDLDHYTNRELHKLGILEPAGEPKLALPFLGDFMNSIICNWDINKFPNIEKFFTDERNRVAAMEELNAANCKNISGLLDLELDTYKDIPMENEALADPVRNKERSRLHWLLAGTSRFCNYTGEWLATGASTIVNVVTCVPYIAAGVKDYNSMQPEGGMVPHELVSILGNTLILTGMALTAALANPMVRYLAHLVDPKKYPTPLAVPAPDDENKSIGFFGQVVHIMCIRQKGMRGLIDAYNFIRPYYLVPYLLYGISYSLPEKFPTLPIITYINATAKRFTDQVYTLTSEIPAKEWISNATTFIGFTNVKEFTKVANENTTITLGLINVAQKKLTEKLGESGSKVFHINLVDEDIKTEVATFLKQFGNPIIRYKAMF